MSIPLEAPYDRSDLLREPSDAMADAAQRDLFEYFAPPLTKVGAPPLAADVPPAATPDTVAATEDEDVACRDQNRHDQTRDDQTRDDQTWHDQTLAWPDDMQDDEILHHETEPPDEIAAHDPGACAEPSEVMALDEVSKANLRRLETTLNWLQSEVEACRLPPATPLPPISGLPVAAPIIDRSTLDRTLHRAPPLPAWLREPRAAPAPPPCGRASWPRGVKFLIACAIAAPLSYYFAVTTSPLQQRLVEIAAAALPDAPVVRPPEPRHRLRVSRAAPELAPQVSALAPEPIVETPALPKPVKLETPIRSSAELPMAEAAASPATAVPAQAGRTEAPRVEASRVEASQVEAPRVRAANAQIVTGPPALAVAEDIGASAPPPAVPATVTAEPQDVKLLIDQGRQFFDVGDLIAARILFLRAANAGDAAAAVAMGATYDPVVLAGRSVRGVAADLDKARRWYERAKEMGSPEGPRRLEMLANR
jgi:hypothetical protein